MISLPLFLALKNILVLLAKPDSGKLHCPATALITLIIHRELIELLDAFSKAQILALWSYMVEETEVPGEDHRP